MSATYFELHSRDLIEFFFCGVTCPNPAGGYYANIASAASHGVEVQGSISPNSHLDLSLNYTLTDTEDKSAGSPTYGKELPRRPQNAANALLTYHWSAALSSAVALHYAGPSYDDPANQITLGGYVLVDVRASYVLNDRLELFARAENVTDKHYETVYQYGTLGRVAYAGVRAKF